MAHVWVKRRLVNLKVVMLVCIYIQQFPLTVTFIEIQVQSDIAVSEQLAKEKKSKYLGIGHSFAPCIR